MNQRIPLLLLGASMLAACAGLSAPPTVSQTIYQLDSLPPAVAVATRRDLVLAIGAMRARPGFESADIAYVRQPHEISYFVTSRWAAAPARMLEPVMLQALENSAGFRAVLPAVGSVAADLRLETELVRLQQDFSQHPSRVQVTLRAQLFDLKYRRLLASREFDESESSASDNAYGGVVAANRAIERVLQQLVDFCLKESGAH
jgi:cholesterol transport system auxiliary component